jgi:hypothetical protein
MTTRCATCTLGQCVDPSACLMIYTMGYAAGVASQNTDDWAIARGQAERAAYETGYRAGVASVDATTKCTMCKQYANGGDDVRSDYRIKRGRTGRRFWMQCHSVPIVRREYDVQAFKRDDRYMTSQFHTIAFLAPR